MLYKEEGGGWEERETSSTFVRDITCRHVSGLLPSGCVGKEAACDTCNRLHFVPGHTLLSGFTLSCTRNDLTFPTPCRSIYFGHLGFQGAVDSVRDSGLFSSSQQFRLTIVR